MYAKIRAEITETRREDGCEVYTWFENVELPGHLRLLECWADQVLYDRHWHLRLASAAFHGDPLRVPARPERWLVSREFYREQQFRHHYHRWLPKDPSAATTLESPLS